jgi:hypothetical protein
LIEVKGELSVVRQLYGRSLNGCGSATLLETVELIIRQLGKRLDVVAAVRDYLTGMADDLLENVHVSRHGGAMPVAIGEARNDGLH